jgi:pyruvate kinase
VKNNATLAGFIFNMHVSQVHIDLPTLTDTDNQVVLIPFVDVVSY